MLGGVGKSSGPTEHDVVGGTAGLDVEDNYLITH